MRPWLLLFALLVAIPIVAQALIVQQRDQISVTIVINVTPAPLGFRAGPPVRDGSGIVSRLVLNPQEPLERSFDAQNLVFGSGNLLAQNQGAVKVEAEVSPNPLGTLLFSDKSGVSVNQTAGTTATVPCAYHVTVDTTKTYWQLKTGLYTDFASNFPGGDVAHNTYISTPHPAATAFVVFSDDGGNWTNLDTNGGAKTYCVDLQVSIPGAIAQGSYSSNAVYTLYY